jgi:hypothetical protein
MKVGIVDAAFHADRPREMERLTLDCRRGRGVDHAGVPDFKWQKDAMVLYRKRTPRSKDGARALQVALRGFSSCQLVRMAQISLRHYSNLTVAKQTSK